MNAVPEIAIYRTVAKPEWIDHNGHMNVACFVVAFDEATDDVYEGWGLGLGYPSETGCSVFTLGMNVDYLGEVFEGDALRIETILLDHDAKRVHYYHEMYQGESQTRIATNECLAMNVDLGSRKSCPFPEGVQNALQCRVATGERPKGVGRTLGIRRS